MVSGQTATMRMLLSANPAPGSGVEAPRRRGDPTGQDGVVSAHGQTVTVEGPETFNVDGDVRAVPHGRFALGPRVSVVVDR
jgi:hypothetical protein